MKSAGVCAIVLYGSHARGESDHESDVDVLVITTEEDLEFSEDDLRDLAPELPNIPLSISIYKRSKLELMLSSGSLFAWHLKTEGKVLFGREAIKPLWNCLQLFNDHVGELSGYMEIMKDMEEAFSEHKTPNEFDLAVIFTIIRNSCIVLSNWIGKPKFGRLDCIETILDCYSWFPFSRRQVLDLSKWKNAYERGSHCSRKLPSLRKIGEFIQSTKLLVGLGIEETSDY